MRQQKKKYLPWKTLTLLLILFFNNFSAQSQLLKRIRDAAKATVENKATDKVNEKMNQGIDSVLKKGGKKNSGKKSLLPM
jgi:hypothetical protein